MRVAPWHAGRILRLLVRRYHYREFMVMTEADVDGYRADFVTVTKAGYLTEFEIKVSASDWRSDKERRKWQQSRPHVRQFYYVVPESLAAKVPEFVPNSAGILIARQHDHWEDSLIEHRPAARMSAQKVTPEWLRAMQVNSYYRYWNAEYRRLIQQSRPKGWAQAVAA